ncbi:MAG: isocitrate dehydrogenase (NADP(+)) [Candidatus Zixiibacteriota bacterium]
MAKYKHIVVPAGGAPITVKNKKLVVPDNPIIPCIEGDGIGRDIMKATRRVVDAAVAKAYGGKKRIAWMDVYAGEKANELYDEWLPKETIDAVKKYYVGIKGPLTTPIGGGFRSLNVTIRQVMNLYACVRPVRYFPGVGSPVVHPERVNVVIFRENTEDVYAGIEWKKGSAEAKKVIAWLNKSMKTSIRPDSGVGIKPMSATGSKRLVRKAVQFAIDKNRKSVTLVHKGNIMKYTEGAFRDWGYEVATKEFGDRFVTEEDVTSKHGGTVPAGKIVIKDRIADSMFQQVLTRADEYDVVATPNLNGDYLSDALAAQVGGLGMAPGANIGDFIGMFEATHGTAPKYADKDMVNPGSLLLSAVLMLQYLGWDEAAVSIERALEKTIQQKTVTYDLERQMEGATRVSTSQFATHIINNL